MVRIPRAGVLFLATALMMALAAGAVLAGEGPAAAAPTTGASGPVEQPATDAAAETGAVEIDLDDVTPRWSQHEVLGVRIWQILAVFVLILLGLVLKKVADYVAAHRVIPFLRKTSFQFDHLIAEAAAPPAGWLLLILGLYLAISVLARSMAPGLQRFVFGAAKLLIAADVLWFLFRLIDVSEHYLRRLTQGTESHLDDQLVPVIRKALKATVGVLGFVWVVEWLGGDVKALLAGLGIGGLAVALALQDTLANFFGSVFIFLDRPFIIGEWVKVGEVEGIVEEIGFRSTRIRTWPATLVSIPNKRVADSTIDNHSKMPKRRVSQTVGVTYETTAEQMEQAVDAIRAIVEGDEGVDQEFIVVRFQDFGASSLNILVYYFTTAVAFADHLAVKQRINLAIMRKVEELGLSIAFPTQTLYFEGDIARAMAGMPGAPDA